MQLFTIPKLKKSLRELWEQTLKSYDDWEDLIEQKNGNPEVIAGSLCEDCCVQDAVFCHCPHFYFLGQPWESSPQRDDHDHQFQKNISS